MADDYYSTLGVGKNASADEIKKAYRRLAHEHHPDKSSGDAEKFKKVNEAYQVLSNPEKRQQYDRFGTTFNAGQTGFGGFGRGQQGYDFSDFASNFGFGQGNVEFEDAFDIFSDIFGGGGAASGRRSSRRERGVDLEMELNLSFTEAVFGIEKEIAIEKKDVCPRCNGNGAEPGTKIETCPKCHGTGQIRSTKRTIFGQVATVATCDRCEGSGKVPENPCSECGGDGTKRRIKTLNIKVPPGVDDGMRIRIANEGEVGYRGSNFGDLYLKINVATDKRFRREGFNLMSEAAVGFTQAALGATITVETIDGKVDVKVPAGTQSGKVLRLKGKGVPQGDLNRRGDHMLTVRVVTPSKLTKKEKELFKKLAEERGESVNPDEGFWNW
ncbi:MAG: molecular chaperone DnaJ [Acidobacteriaceae bacterium]